MKKRSLDDLISSEERFRSTLEQSPVSTQILTPDGKTVMVNKAWEKLWGAKFSQIKDYNMLKDKQLVDKGVMPYIKRGFKGEDVSIPAIKYVPSETVKVKGVVSHKWVKAKMYPIKNKDGSVREVVLMHEDITKSVEANDSLRQRIEQQKTVSYLGEIALSGVEMKDLMDIAVKELARVLDVNYTKILELLPDRKDFVIRAGFGWKKEYKMGETKVEVSTSTQAGYTLLSKKPVIVKDLPKETRFRGHKILKDHKVKSGISVMIKGVDKPFGILSAHCDQSKIFTRDDINFVQAVANVIGLALERKKTENFLNLYQERFEQAQKAGHIGVYDWDILNNELWWSEEEAELYGFPAGYKPNPKTAEFMKNVPPEDFEKLRSEMRLAREKGEEYSGEMRIIDKKGIRWLKTKGRYYYDKNNNPVRFLGVNYDITDRKRYEDSMTFLAEASRIFSSSLDYRKTLDSISHLAVPTISDWCAVEMLKEDGSLEQLSVVHQDEGKIKWANRLRTKYPVDMNDETGLAKVLKTGKPEFYPYIPPELFDKTAKNDEHRRILKHLGIVAAMIVPIKSKGKVIGAIEFVSSESKRRFNKVDFDMAQQLADRASVAVENSLLYEEVNSERKRLTHLLANVPGVVWEAWGQPDKEGQRIDFVSNYVETMLGYSVDEWLSKPNFWLSIVHPKDKERAAQESADIFNSGEGGISRFRWVTKGGRPIWVEAHSFVVRDKVTGKPIGMRGVTMDISERMEIEKRKDEFITMASHELKTPLTSMKVFSHLLNRNIKRNGNGVGNYLDRMDEQIDKLTNLVNDLLDISKIQAGKLQLRREKFSLKELIKNTVEEMRTVTGENIVLKNLTDKWVYADKDRVSQVILNLLTNAIKYSPPKAPVEVSVTDASDKVVVAVKDKGVGINEEHQTRIFDRFYRVYDNVDRTFPGLGMGLYISKEIVNRHDGDMWLESKKGRGSTFYFSLPLAQEKYEKNISN